MLPPFSSALVLVYAFFPGAFFIPTDSWASEKEHHAHEPVQVESHPAEEEDPLIPDIEGHQLKPTDKAMLIPAPAAVAPAAHTSPTTVPTKKVALKPEISLVAKPEKTTPKSGMGFDEIVEKLKEGNQRYVKGQAYKPRQDSLQRSRVAKDQKPMVAVVGCADSRVPPEIIFDQGLGDLFIVRNAGNVLEPSIVGSLEYAVEHLGVTVILVLGHERCGAVKAACEPGKPTGHIGNLVEAIYPAVEYARTQGGDLLTKAVKANVYRVIDEINSSWPILAPLSHKGKLEVLGAVYDLDDGLVTFLP